MIRSFFNAYVVNYYNYYEYIVIKLFKLNRNSPLNTIQSVFVWNLIKCQFYLNVLCLISSNYFSSLEIILQLPFKIYSHITSSVFVYMYIFPQCLLQHVNDVLLPTRSSMIRDCNYAAKYIRYCYNCLCCVTFNKFM